MQKRQRTSTATNSDKNLCTSVGTSLVAKVGLLALMDELGVSTTGPACAVPSASGCGCIITMGADDTLPGA